MCRGRLQGIPLRLQSRCIEANIRPLAGSINLNCRMPISDGPEPRAYQYLIGLLLRTAQYWRRALRARDRRLLSLGVATTFFYRSLRRARTVMQARDVKLRGMWETIGSLTRRVREERVALQASDA